jgi:predicted enzyme related to lactoylglutathione lyase
MTRIFGLTALVLVLWSSALPAQTGAAVPPLPALNNPATEEHLPGTFIFADFFTSDIEAARRFYGGLFGWEWRWTSADHSYGMFYQDGIAVAGVVLHEAADKNRPYGRWIYYLSSDDVADKVADITAHGGRVLLEPRDLPARGTLAVVADEEGAPFGLLDSSSGDPADYRAEPGEWLWVSLYSRDTHKALDFYRMLFDYDVSEADDTGDGLDFILSQGGYARAGVGHLAVESDSHPTWLGYIRVEDVAASVARAVSEGGAVLIAPEPALLDGNLAVVSDPMGAPIALIHWTFDDAEAAR